MLSKRIDFKSAYERAETYLSNAIERGRLPHALIIAGPEGSGRRELARFVFRKLLKAGDSEKLDSDPDYIEIDCDPYKTDVDSMRGLLEELRKKPFSDGFRAVLLHDAHLLKEQYQDTLLKTIEEPPKNTMFIFAGNEAGLLPTIRSRCAVVRLGTRDTGDVRDMMLSMGAASGEAELLAKVSGGVPGRARDLYLDKEKKKIRDLALDSLEAACSGKPEFSLGSVIDKMGDDLPDKGRGLAVFALECMLSYCRDLLLIAEGFEAEENIDRAAKLLLSAGRFTSGKINCMIDLLLEAKGRLTRNADPERTLDRLFIDFSEVL
jgi:DNA polymerase-3 subunit delta'